MSSAGTLKIITEGKTKLIVPDVENPSGPATHAAVFYNPAMVSNRDVSVLYARCRAREGWLFLDALAGTGARGVRLAVEVPVKMQVHINDMSQEAVGVMKENIQINGLKNVTTSQQDLHDLLPGVRYDWIDLDPYGSPINFIDQSVQKLPRGGTLSITATDTAPLCGTFPRACARRYMARPMKSQCKHELGLRILVGNIVRRAAVLDVALFPELAYYQGHFFRSYFRLERGATKASGQIEKIGYLQWDDKEGFSTNQESPEGKDWAGPLWLGDLTDKTLVKEMLAKSDETISKTTSGLLQALDAELTQPPYHYNTDFIARLLNRRPMKMLDTLETLRKKGFSASTVHYDPKGFKTDAGLGEIIKILGNT